MEQDKKLVESLKELSDIQLKLLSPKQNFIRGVYYSLGFFVGSTILVGLLIYMLTFLNTAPLIGGFISKILHFVK